MRTLLRPRMLVLHALVLAVVYVLVSLGMWQLGRLDEARTRADAVAIRLAGGVDEVTRLLDGVTIDDTDMLADLDPYRVMATGTYRPEDEVLQRGRSHAGQQGFHVLTPLDLTDGTTLLVRRGWIPFDNDLRPPAPDALPPAGEVRVMGYLERSVPQPESGIAQRDPDDGELEIIFNTDLRRLGPQLGENVRPMLLLLSDQLPQQTGDLPIPAPPPSPDLGSHLSYAIQWFSFATIAAGMYAIWLRRRLRGDERAISPDAGHRSS